MQNVPVVELDTIRASDAPGPGSSPGGHTIKKNEFFKIRSFSCQRTTKKIFLEFFSAYRTNTVYF